MPDQLISLVVPTLNEALALGFLFPEIEKVFGPLKNFGYTLELIIVDDGSSDGTREKIKAMRNSFSYKIILIERDIKDLATAVLEGFKNSSGSILGVMDADMSHPPEMILPLVRALADADIAVGSRNIPGGGVENWPLHRRLASRAGALCARVIGIKIKDPMSGLFFFKKSVIEGVHFSPIGYKILLEILVKGHYNKVVEMPYIFLNRTVGKSKLGGSVMINYLKHLARLLIWKIQQK